MVDTGAIQIAIIIITTKGWVGVFAGRLPADDPWRGRVRRGQHGRLCLTTTVSCPVGTGDCVASVTQAP